MVEKMQMSSNISSRLSSDPLALDDRSLFAIAVANACMISLR
jgi:hypothetical protein